MTRRMRVLTVAGAALSLVLSTTVVTAQASHRPYCGIYWGSLAKSASSTGTGSSTSLTNVRTGRHACFDRLVLDLAGDGTARVRYVRQVVMDGSGFPVPLRGAADLEIITGPFYDVETGAPTYSPANPRELRNVSGYRTFRQVASAGSFEGQGTVGLGVRARLPFRVFGLSGPGQGSRIVIDVAHRW